ncbi:MAG: hypothetical protein ACK419_06335, partial [Pyrinomonadaceae bacterium]
AKTRLGVEPVEGAKFQLIFSAQGFPGLHLRFQRQEPEFNGYWYITESQDWAWFSPSLTHFFHHGQPKEIHLQIFRCVRGRFIGWCSFNRLGFEKA